MLKLLLEHIIVCWKINLWHLIFLKLFICNQLRKIYKLAGWILKTSEMNLGNGTSSVELVELKPSQR